jgi:hypothetical protein
MRAASGGGGDAPSERPLEHQVDFAAAFKNAQCPDEVRVLARAAEERDFAQKIAAGLFAFT